MTMARIPNTDLDIFPLCLGGNVFGWTANEQESFDVLDAYAAVRPAWRFGDRSAVPGR